MKPNLSAFSKPVLVCLAIFFGLTASTVRGITIAWNNTTGGVWSSAVNWNPHVVPTALDTVQITTPGTYTVTVDTTVTISSLTLGGTSGVQTLTNNLQTVTITNGVVAANGILSFGAGTLNGGLLTIQGTFNWGSAAVLSPVTVTTSAVLNFNGSGAIESPLTNAGTINWSGVSSSLSMYNNTNAYKGAIYNQASGLFNIQNDLGMSASYGFESFNNAGIVRKTAGVGATSFGPIFTNSGTIDVQSGSIHLNGGGNIGGTYNTASGAIIEFDAGTFTETGIVTVTGAGICRQNGATVRLNDRITKFVLFSGNVLLSPTFETTGTIQNLQLDGAFLAGTNVVTGTLGINGGGLASVSPLTVAPGGVLNFNGAAASIYSPLTNSGTINWSGLGITVYNNNSPTVYSGTIQNQPGGLFNMQNDQAVSSAQYGFETFRNAGTVRKSAGVGASSFNLPFTNTGTVDAETGTIQFAAGGTLGGTYNTASGGLIQFNTGSFAQTGPVTVTGAGVCRQNGATFTLNDRIAGFLLFAGNVALTPTFETNGTIQNLQLDGAFLMGTNVVTGTLGLNGGGLASASPLTVATNGVLNFNGAAVAIYSPLTNSGVINWSGLSVTIYNNNSPTVYTGIIKNQTNGIFNLLSDQTLSSAQYGFESFVNAGTMRKTAGLGLSSISVPFTNTGTIDAQSGTIQFAAGGTLGGTYNTASGAIIQFTGGSFAQTGPVTVTGAGVCRQNGAMVTLNDRIAGLLLFAGNVALTPTFETNGTIQNLQLDGAFLLGTNVVTGTLGFNGGGLASASPLTVATNGVLNFNGAAVAIYSPLTNSGVINWSGLGVTIYNNNSPAVYTGIIKNQTNGIFNLLSDQTLGSAQYGFESFVNAGTMRKTAGLGLSSISVASTNTGTVDAQSGTIQFAAGGTLGGTNNTASGAIIQFTGGNFLQGGPVTVTGTGLCRQNGANVTLNDRIPGFLLFAGNVALTPTFETNGTIQNLQLDGAFLVGTNVVTGTLGFNGGGLGSASPLTVAASGVLNFNGAAAAIYSPLTNSGTINWSGLTITIYNNNTLAAYTGVINNLASGVFNIESDQGLSSAQYGFESILNSGTVRKTAGLGTTTCGVPFTNTGTLDVQSGILRFNASYTQSGGTMNFGITSLAYFGQIAFNSNALLTGGVSVNFNSGYSPSAGDSFVLVTYPSHTGLFTSQALPPAAQWQTNYSATTFSVTVLSVNTGAGSVTLPPISNRTINAGTILSITNTATDSNPGNQITYSLTAFPPGATIGSASGILQWRGTVKRGGDPPTCLPCSRQTTACQPPATARVST